MPADDGPAELPTTRWDAARGRLVPLTPGEVWHAVLEPDPPPPVLCGCLHLHRVTRGLAVAAAWCDRCDNSGVVPG